MAKSVREFDPEDEGRDSVTEDGVTRAEPTFSVELAPVKSAPKVSRTQARAAANMKYAGASWEDIADFLDYKDAAVARQVVEAHIAKAYPDQTRESLFRIHAARLEQLWALAHAKSQPMVQAYDDYGDEIPGHRRENPEQLAYMKVGLDIVSRSMRLHGLEAPTQVEITPNIERFEDVVQKMVAQVRGDTAVEVDVVEYAEIEAGEIDEDDLDD